MISAHQKVNFETLKRAFQQGEATLLECYDTQENMPVVVICAPVRAQDETIWLVPIARFFNDNPYEHIVPPSHVVQAWTTTKP